MTKELAEKHLIFKVLSGSRAYGFSTPESDYDYRGVFIPPEEYFLGLNAFDILDVKKDEDAAYYSLRQFATLAFANNPNVLEILFVDDKDVIIKKPEFQPFLDNRKAFLSQKCAKTYVGYASAQLHRIRNHKRWLNQELRAMEVLLPELRGCGFTKKWVQWRFGTNMVERLEQGMKPFEGEWLVKKAWEQDVITPAMDCCLKFLGGATGLAEPIETDPFFYYTKEIAGSEIVLFDSMKFKEAKKKRQQYIEWMANRDPKRHEAELKFGYDTRHAAHLVRLLRTGYEILTEGKLQVARPDADEILSIRQGAWSYDKVTGYADEMLTKIQEIKDFAVPEVPDYKLINKLTIDVTKETLWPKATCQPFLN